MCLYLRDKKPRVAKEDITVLKYVKVLTKKSEIASLNLKKKELLDKIAELDKQIQSL